MQETKEVGSTHNSKVPVINAWDFEVINSQDDIHLVMLKCCEHAENKLLFKVEPVKD